MTDQYLVDLADRLIAGRGVGPRQPLTRRQKQILDDLQEFIQAHGYAPSLEEIAKRFSLSALATIHKHLTNLEQKGCIRRQWNRSRSIELIDPAVDAVSQEAADVLRALAMQGEP